MHLDAGDCIALGKKVINEMDQNLLTVLYFGGEPLLRFKDIQMITPLLKMHADKAGKSLLFTITTNGSIMSPEIFKHLSSYRYFVTVSYDLSPTSHDTHRGWVGGNKKSSDKVLETIKLLVGATKDLCVSAVVTNKNVKYMADGFKELIDLGVRNFAITPVVDNIDYVVDPAEYANELLRIADIAYGVSGNLTINPPFDRGWHDPSLRAMFKTHDSVNVELNPFEGMTILSEKRVEKLVDYGTLGPSGKIGVPNYLRRKISKAERDAAAKYRTKGGYVRC